MKITGDGVFSVCLQTLYSVLTHTHTSATDDTDCMFLEVMTHCYISAALRNQKFIFTQNTVLRFCLFWLFFFPLPGVN